MSHRSSTIACGASVLVLALGATPPAAAEPTGIELSRDGKVWASDLADPLLDDLPALVPGDRVTRTLYVRNAAPAPARLTVDVSTASSGGLARYLVVSAFPEHVRPAPAVTHAPCKADSPAQLLAPGETQRVRIGVEMADVPGQVAQSLLAELTARLRLTQVRSGGGDVVCGVEAEVDLPLFGAGTSNAPGSQDAGAGKTPAGSVALPGVGADLDRSVILAAALSTGLGAALLGHQRARRRTGRVRSARPGR